LSRSTFSKVTLAAGLALAAVALILTRLQLTT